ncbi:MAG: ABC transporter permease subunit [Verrucomicrobiota bacterium]|nr:ABC transporter permease subunit [Verrucomicrobiota bacterium]
MFIYILKRLLMLIPILFVVVTLTFFLMRIAPGGPFSAERKLPESVEKKLLEKYKLDGTLWQQYSSYLKDVAQGDLRLSTKYMNRSVNEIIAQTLPVSATLGSIAFVLAICFGTFIGSLAALKQNSWQDNGLMLVAMLAISIPTYVTAPLLILFLAVNAHIFPVAGWGTIQQLILPAFCLSLPFAAYVARLMRTSMLETLNQDFVRTARSKGLSEWKVLFKHALKVAILPVVSFAGPLAANILTGSLVVEEIFKIPGMGPFFVFGVINRDLFLVGGVVIVYCILLVVLNLVVDILYTFLDRRIKIS